MYTAKLISSRVDFEKSSLIALQNIELSVKDENLMYDETQIKTEDDKTISLKKRKWGAFDMYIAAVMRDTDTLVSKVAIIGASRDPRNSTALLLHKSPSIFSVAENVNIKGNLYLPHGLARRFSAKSKGNIFSGIVFSSPDSFPCLDQSFFLRYFDNFGDGRRSFSIIEDTLKNSFLNATKVLEADTIILEGALSGNIIVLANYVRISSTAEISGIVIKCKSAIVEPNFRGDMQIIAFEDIVVSRNSKLNYPSVLCLLSNNKSDKGTVGISVMDSSVICGDIYALSLSGGNKSIIFSHTSTTIGGVYSQFAVNLKGNFYGTVIAKQLIDNTHGVIQENLASNLNLYVDSLPVYYAHATIFPFTTQKMVVQWCK